MKKQLEENDEKFKDLDVKLQDLNIIDMLKLNVGGEGGDMNIILGLVSNIEKKTNSKNKLMEEKIAKIDGNCFKITKEVQNIKNSQDLNKRQIETNKKSMEDLITKCENLNKVVEVNNEEINDKLESKIAYLERFIKESIEVLKKGINKKLNVLDENITIGKETPKETINTSQINNINIENNKEIKALKESINDINKKIKLLPTQSDLDQIKSDISALKSGMNNSVRLTDFNYVKEILDDNRANIKKLKEDFEDFQNNRSEGGDLQNLKRKVEILVNKVHDMEEGDYGIRKNTGSNSNDDKYRFLEYKIFDEFKAQIVKEFNNINENFVNSRKLLDELIDSVRNRTSFKDLKALEDAVMSKMEDLKIASGKKFADRNEVNRTIKYLDQQIRNIVQVYIKKIEKGDNWLLAKKPITNNLCASCESYIGDLKDAGNNNNVYIPWNKYPVKDPNDKLYRMGNGFSKMLQMIQVDENDKKSAFQTYNEMNEISKNKNNLTKTEFFSGSNFDDSELSPQIKNLKHLNNRTVSNMNKTTQKSLPKLKKHKIKRKNINMTGDSEPNINMNNDSEDNEEEPKITKIFRVNKDQH